MPNQNTQLLESLPLMEDFYTIQGEGEYQGVPAYFIRLGGCDVGCVWCDVKESWDADAHPVIENQLIAQKAAASGAKIAVITGGEPLMYNMSHLTAQLKKAGLKTHLETSGAYPLTGTFDWVCVSPKKFKAPLEKVLKAAHELKVIVFHQSDFDWAEKHAKSTKKDCKLFFQPEWSKRDKMLPLIIKYVKNNPQWNISLQIHKYMGID